ncbi:unnamed protein product [Hymenolepis diminuta]|uniref:Uncharacterized protein n=1 Tax=Hymenolepis diminuta TaxID=6216 RepID=A0A564YE34_HYMDI|nr:unnamed protein product [Hymenolepis diminuta]
MEFTTLPRPIKRISRALEHSRKCGRVTNRAASKRGCACGDLPSQLTISICAA